MKPIVKIGGVLIALAMLCLVFLNPSSCKSKRTNKGLTKAKKECSIRTLVSSVESGEPIQYITKSLADKVVTDSLIFVDGMLMDGGDIPTREMALGRHDIRVKYLYSDSTHCESSWSVEILSDVEPMVMQYNVLNMYDHNVNAYTQGLLWHEGRIYESTGQHGESLIYHYNPKKSDYQNRVDLAMTYFGEGITVLGDKLYQLTYKSGKGFFYDIDSMEQLGEFDLPTQEGWGLTDNGSELILSDGSHKLTVLDSKTFEVLRTIPVYDNERKVENLNELEYVDGFIYANIYGATIIAKIDLASGKVIEYIDCRGILAPELQTSDMDVFNGIAYDSSRRTFFVTGKYWPKLFEVSFVPRPS